MSWSGKTGANPKAQYKANPKQGGANKAAPKYKGKEFPGRQDAQKYVYPIDQLPKGDPVLLDDESVKTFIRDGFLVLDCEFPYSFHEVLLAQVNSMDTTQQSNPGNNILAKIPMLGEVYKSPKVKGALTSLLGEGYIMHPHRFCHETTPGKPSQKWHKDSYWGFSKPRHHRTRWAMAMYYPTKVTMEMGPTGIRPSSQYLSFDARNRNQVQLPESWQLEEMPMVTQSPGTIVIIAYDLWHKGMANYSPEKNRYMFKFQFVRTKEPKEPSWNCQDLDWHFEELNQWNALWHSMWMWMCGKQGEKTDSLNSNLEQLNWDTLLQNTGDISVDNEPSRICSNYWLSQMKPKMAVSSLIKKLKNNNAKVRLSASYGLINCGSEAVEPLLDLLNTKDTSLKEAVIFILMELAQFCSDRIGHVVSHLSNGAPNVRRISAEALGIFGQFNPQNDIFIETLMYAFQNDDDEQTRSLIQLTQHCNLEKYCENILQSMMNDTSRYTRNYAVELMKAINTEKSNSILIDFLMNAKLCSITTEKSCF